MANNLDITQLVPAQDDKETFINGQVEELQLAITEAADFAVDDSNALTITSAQLRENQTLRLIDGAPVPDAAITITVPAVIRGMFAVVNTTAFDATVEISGQAAASPIVTAGDTFSLVSDGTNVRATGRGSDALDMSFFVPGIPTAALKVFKHVATRRFTLNDDLVSSEGHADTVGTVAVSDFDVEKNGSSIGTISFAVATATATFVTAGSVDEVFDIGDRLTVLAPSPANAALADIAISLFGFRS